MNPNQKKQEYQVLLFYKYVRIPDVAETVKAQRELCESLNLTGRILIAAEGINGTLEGEVSAVARYQEAMRGNPLFSDIAFKKSPGTGAAFPRLMVKERPEVVTSGFAPAIDPEKRVTGKYLKPEELKEWIKSGREFYIVDMRNDYEQKSGYFDGSILSGVKNFKDLPKFIPKIKHLKDKEILTVCTGGIRCEKASGLLLENGFENVYQLEGGIHSYMEKYPNEDFKGKLYVFDNRLLVGFNTTDSKHELVGRCETCGKQSENYVNCAHDACHKHYIACEDCHRKSGGYCSLKCRLFKFIKRMFS